MFPPLDILREYWIEHVTFGFLYVMFTFPTRIFYGGVPGFATKCPCGVWCRGLTTCLLYVGPHFGDLVQNGSNVRCPWFVMFHISPPTLLWWLDVWLVWHRKHIFSSVYFMIIILTPHNMMILQFRLPHFHVSNSALFSTKNFCTLIFHRRIVLHFL